MKVATRQKKSINLSCSPAEPMTHLQEEEVLCYVLHQLFFNILWVKLGQEMKHYGLFFGHIMIQNLLQR